MSSDPGQTTAHVLGFEDRSRGEQRGDEVVGERDPRPALPCLGMPRLGRRDALAPASDVLGDDAHEDGALLALLPEARAEGSHQGKGDLEQLHRTDRERRLAHGSSRAGANTYLPPGAIRVATRPAAKHRSKAAADASRHRVPRPGSRVRMAKWSAGMDSVHPAPS